MSFRPLLAVAVSLTALVAAAAEIPLSSPPVGPAPGIKRVLAGIGTPDGFLTIRMEGSYYSGRLMAARLSLDGQVLDPRGNAIGSLDHSIYPRTYDLRAQSGGYVFTAVTPFRSSALPILEYQQKRITLDSEGRLVSSVTTPLSPKAPQNWPANTDGETLFVGAPPEYRKVTILFVGRDGVPRNPTPLSDDLTEVLSIVPYGGDWLILAVDRSGRVHWYRIKESTRNTPVHRTIQTRTTAGNRTIANADGHFAVLLARSNLTLHVITPEGVVRKYPLESNEPLPDQAFSTPRRGTIAREGDSWLVAYRWLLPDGREELRMWRVGTKVESSVLNAGSRSDPLLVPGPARNLLLVRRDRPASRRGWDDVYAYAFDRGAFIAPSQPSSLLAWSLPPQTNPSAAAGPHGVLAAWVHYDGDMAVSFIGANGTASTPLPIPSSAWEAQPPAVARNGDTFVVGWQEWSGQTDLDARQRVKIVRFDGHGTPIDREPRVVHDLPTAPDTYGISIAAEGDGFRLAWLGRLLPDHFGGAAPAVFTMHVQNRGDELPEPEALVLPGEKFGASRPAVVSNGIDSIVFWTQPSSNGLSDVVEKHYPGGLEVRRFPSFTGLESRTVAAAANDDEVLLATVRSSADGKDHCTEVHRVSFRGEELAPAVTLECGPVFPAHIAVAWDRNRWWVTSTASSSDVHELNAGGILAGSKQIFPTGAGPRLIQFLEAPAGTSAVYVRDDASTDFVERAFLRTFPRPKVRSARP